MKKRSKPKSRGSVTLLGLMEMGAFAGQSPGQRIIARFCNAVLNGGTVRQDDAVHIAQALLPFLEQGHTHKRSKEAARLLGVTKKQGRQPGLGLGDIEKDIRAIESVFEYLELQKNKNPVQARKIICGKFRIGDRTLRDRIKKYADQPDALKLASYIRGWKP